MKGSTRMLSRFVARAMAVMCAVVFVAGPASTARADINVWTTHGPEGWPVVALAVDPTTPGTVYAGTQYGGVFKSTDGALSWQAISTGLTDMDVSTLAIDPIVPSTLYAGTSSEDNGRGQGVFKSTDGGTTWNAVNIGLADDFADLAIAIDPSTPRTLYVATLGDHVYKSTDGALSWRIASTGLPDQPINELAIDPSAPTTLYAGTGGGPSVYKSTDGAMSWQPATAGMPKDIHVRALAIDPTMPQTLYAATEGGMFKSTDGATHWQTVNAGLPDYGNGPPVFAIAIDPNTPATLYAGTYGGIFKSTDGAASWRVFDSRLGALAIEPGAPSTLYAATRGGVYSIEQVAAGVVGTGTAASCTDAALDAALASGVAVAFDCGGPATIDISTGTGTKTIAADTTIDGGGLITISGGELAEVFAVPDGVNFTVQNLTIANGYLAGNDGGGIANGSGTLTVTNCAFTGNSAFGGGGIFSNGGPVIVTDSTFTGNSGGGIFSIGGSLTVSDSAFTDNGGSGIYVDGSHVDASRTVTNCTFTRNSAGGGAGGGIANAGGTLTVANSTFAGNSADNGGAIGGGGATLVTNSTFAGNRADRGGAIENGGPLTVTNCTFTGNGADHEGGGIANLGGTLTVANSTFAGNNADLGGGIIVEGGTLTITNSTVVGNSATNGGGGILSWPPCDFSLCNLSFSLLLRNTILANNPGDNCSGRTIIDDGHNLDDGTSCGFGTAAGSLSNTNPALDPAGLRDNGGLTQTVALCTKWNSPAGCTAASPAMNAGDPAVCAAAPVNDLDQRGLMRPGTGHTTCSMGAFEADLSPVVCVGDCNNDSKVGVGELITLVSISLGSATIEQCEAAIFCNGRGQVSVDCLVRAVNSALVGCFDPCVEGCVGGG